MNQELNVKQMILTVFGLQQLLEVLLRLLLHYRLTGTNVWKKTFSSATCEYDFKTTVKCSNAHAGWAADVPVSTPWAPPTQTSSSALCPSHDVSGGPIEGNKASDLTVTWAMMTHEGNKWSSSRHMRSADSWLSDWESQRRWRNARFWFDWRPAWEFRH